MPQLALDPLEARVLGVLIEKELTTPEQYPLSLNSLALGCSQKSNRHPVMELSESDALSALERLRLQQLAGLVHNAGGRVERWRHNARETLDLLTPEIAVLAELLMRGPQQPGELRTRASRMAPLESLEKLDEVLASLEKRGFAKKLPPPPGSRAMLVAQTLAPEAHPVPSSALVASASSAASAPPRAGLESRVAELERSVAQLREELGALRAQLGA